MGRSPSLVLDVSIGMSAMEADTVWNTLNSSHGDIAFVLGALANDKRLQMLASLLKGSQTFGTLRKATGLRKTALAHHLRLMVHAGVLNHTGKGRYELTPDGAELATAVGNVYAGSRRRRELEAARRADYIQKVHTKQKEPRMKKFEVQIVRLEPMRVASARVISKTPEKDAWEKMRAWAEPKGLLDDLTTHPVYGFNNPNPSPGREEYGYEFWIRVDPDVEPEGEIQIKKVEGGLYAVTTCRLKEELESEFFQKEGYLESWKNLVDWVKSSKYTSGSRQCLEKAHDPGASEEELVLDLYCPIEE